MRKSLFFIINIIIIQAAIAQSSCADYIQKSQDQLISALNNMNENTQLGDTYNASFTANATQAKKNIMAIQGALLIKCDDIKEQTKIALSAYLDTIGLYVDKMSRDNSNYQTNLKDEKSRNVIKANLTTISKLCENIMPFVKKDLKVENTPQSPSKLRDICINKVKEVDKRFIKNVKSLSVYIDPNQLDTFMFKITLQSIYDNVKTIRSIIDSKECETTDDREQISNAATLDIAYLNLTSVEDLAKDFDSYIKNPTEAKLKQIKGWISFLQKQADEGGFAHHLD